MINALIKEMFIKCPNCQGTGDVVIHKDKSYSIEVCMPCEATGKILSDEAGVLIHIINTGKLPSWL